MVKTNCYKLIKDQSDNYRWVKQQYSPFDSNSPARYQELEHQIINPVVRGASILSTFVNQCLAKPYTDENN